MRGAQSGFLGNDNAAENAFGDTVVTIQLCGEIRLAGELDHGINALGFVFDGVGETALAPIIDRIDRTVCFDQGLELADQAAEASSSRAELVTNMVSYLAIFCAPPFGL